jgi:hypothetical protein
MITGVSYKNIFKKESNVIQNETIITRDIEMIRDELELLLNFKKHSLFFGNSIGLDLEKYLYLTNRTATFNLIRSEIESLFRKYRRVSLQKIQIRFDDKTNGLVINVEVSYDQFGRTTITVPFSIQN